MFALAWVMAFAVRSTAIGLGCMIPIHATATANPQPAALVVAEDRLPARGTVRRAPGRLGDMLDGGVIDEIEVRTADVLITLRAANSWAAELGDDVRDALCDALLDPAGWRVEGAPDHNRRAGGDRRRAADRIDSARSPNHTAARSNWCRSRATT